jgi:hypothetical protein
MWRRPQEACASIHLALSSLAGGLAKGGDCIDTAQQAKLFAPATSFELSIEGVWRGAISGH